MGRKLETLGGTFVSLEQESRTDLTNSEDRRVETCTNFCLTAHKTLTKTVMELLFIEWHHL